MKINPLNLEKKQITIQPSYLLKMSSYVQILSSLYQQQKLGSLADSFKNYLQKTFMVLGQSLNLWKDNKGMIQSSILKTKWQIQKYCWDKLSILISRQALQIGKLIQNLTTLSQQHYQDYQKILIEQRKQRLYQTNYQQQNLIKNLRNKIQLLNQQIQQLQIRNKDLQRQNSNIYTKLITNAKNTIQYTLSSSPTKNKSLQINKIKDVNNISHKTLSGKQVQQIIIDLMQTKTKQQIVKGKKVPMNIFIKTYFRCKFGMRDLASQAQSSFKQALDYFIKNQQKNIYLVFNSILNDKCQESYFLQIKNLYDKITKFIKRYLNTKSGIAIDQLDKMYDSRLIDQKPDNDCYLNDKDIHVILANIYGIQQVDFLQTIITEIISSKNDQNNIQNHYPSKKIINQILNYELKKHLLEIQDIVEQIQSISIDNKRLYNFQHLQRIAIKLLIPQQKINLLSQEGQDQRFIVSQIIQIIQKLRKLKIKKKL